MGRWFMRSGWLHQFLSSVFARIRRITHSVPTEPVPAKHPRTPESPEQGQRAAIAEVAVLDVVGFLAAATAALILIVNSEANQWWWLGVGLAFALTAITTALLIPMVSRYRATRAGEGTV
jgi:hypothetical protein